MKISPIIPVVVGGTAIAALALALRGKTPPRVPGPVYLKGAAGKVQFEIRFVAPGFAWSVAGERSGAGADNDGATAVLTMLEFAYTSNAAEIVTMQVGKGVSETMAGSLSVHREDDTHWSWLVSGPDKAAIGTGDSTSRGGATLQALSAIAPFTDWLSGLPQAQGSAGELDGTAPPEQRDGLVTTPTSVSAFDLPTWLAHAGPIVLEGIAANEDAKAIHLRLLAELSSESLKYTGKTYASVVGSMQSALSAWYDNKYLAIAPIEYEVAARAVGAKISLPGRTGRVKGRPIVVRYDSGGRWEWLVWAPGNRAADDAAIATGEEVFQARAWHKAVGAAASPDPGKGPTPGTDPDVQGLGFAPAPGTKPPPEPQPPGLGEPPKAPLCSFAKTSSLSRNLTATAFADRRSQEIKLWSPPSSQCNQYVLTLGVCITPSGGGTYGALDAYTKSQAGDGPLTAAEADDIDVRMSRVDGSRVDWHMFRVPQAWKRQYQIVLDYDGKTLAVASTKRIDAPEYDPCPDRAYRWPGIGDDHYRVEYWTGIGNHELFDEQWTAQPMLSIAAEGKSLYVTIEYSGLPYFKNGTLAEQYRTLAVDQNRKTSFTAGFKIRTQGFT